MKLRAALLALTLLASPAWAATGVEALRGTASGLRAQVTSLRAEQLTRRNELSVVSSRIEALKAQTKGTLLPGSELDQSLKRSQELSGTLTELAQQLSAREGELEAANLALLDALSGELTRLRAEFDRQTNRQVRRGLIDQMRKLRSEREAVRAALPATKIPTLDALKPSDDPEELLEQADLLRDNEEKVRKELKALEARITQRREEAELDRRVQRFLGEESMFDDQDRRLRVQRKDQSLGDAPAASGGTRFNASPNAEASDFSNDTAAPPPTVTAGSAPAPDRAPGPTFPSLGGFAPSATRGDTGPGAPAESRGPTGVGALDSRGIAITSGSDARPQVGGGTRSIATGDEDEMEDLDIQRRKLQGLAEELKRKAQALEKKASELK
ncbi:MAG: TetR family transcriptional regulator [Myxococcaceae bacterium]|nr:TetR family transcriptional regulator [Myxococcaceae bacterium]